MPSFTDLLSTSERAETVSVLGQDFECRALTLGEIGNLVWRFAELGELISSRKVDPVQLLANAPHAVAAAIALATKHDDDDAAAAEAIEKLPFGAQLQLLISIIEQSAPGGLVPLVDALGRLASVRTLAKVSAPN